METEVEAKFPNISPDLVRNKLKEIGAIQEHAEVLMKRKNFDFADGSLEKIGGWVRVRDEGNKITLSYKQLNDRTLHGTQEVNVVVGDFDRACEFLNAIGMKQKAYQETKREKWIYEGAEITIDTWPWIPSFVEVEGKTEEQVKKVSRDLGFDWNTAMHGSVETVYQTHYDFSETEIDGWQSITFIPEPEWLLKKRKHHV